MLSEEEVKKIKKELSSFFGNSLSSIVLYGSYAIGKETQ
jgi:predicted nucleotidyltransferase